jgi:Zn-finger nucleic acid-binding protein
VTIARPQGHDAAVVRCASCGAPRGDGAPCCEFCGADFTLREHDLDTICPHCLARISDRAKFCDHCGNPLAAEPLSIEETPLVCPLCDAGSPVKVPASVSSRTLKRELQRPQVGIPTAGPRLHSRLVGGSSVLECPSCAGIWIGAETFQQLIHSACEAAEALDRRGVKPSNAPRAVPPVQPSAGAARKRPYLPCPICRTLMVRQNYAHRSGVIIDLCKRHGIWFDEDKLARILDWARSGGLAAARDEKEAQVAHDERIRKRLELERLAGSPWGSEGYIGGGDGF